MKKEVDVDSDADERQPLNAMVAENLKRTIIRKIYRDVDHKVPAASDSVSPIFRQYLLTTGTSFAGLSSGMTAGFSAVLLPQLHSGDGELTITKDEGSWIASMAALPMMLGCLCSGYPMDKLGRKLAVILSSIIFSTGWAILGLASDVPTLYAGRFVTGFAVGLMAPMCQVYVAESSDPKHRGILLSGAPLSVAIGILMAHVLGTFLHWKITAAVCGVPPLLCILILILVPESPIWLLGSGKSEQADESYQWFHGTSEKAQLEWSTIVSKARETAASSDKTSLISLLKRPSFFKPFLVLNAFFFVQQFSGVNAVAFYCVTIIKEIIPKVNEYLATIIIDVVRFVISVGGVLLLKKFGRKTLAIVSAVGTAVSLFSLSAYLAVDELSMPKNSTLIAEMEMEVEVEGFTALHSVPLICLVAYICFVSIGLVPIPWILTGELFSKELRGIGSGVTSSFGFICYFTVVKSSPDMFENLGKAGTFAFFGSICVVGAVLFALSLPETKDKTLLEIEAYYEKPEAKNEPEMINVRF